jgi:hypothetical protein
MAYINLFLVLKCLMRTMRILMALICCRQIKKASIAMPQLICAAGHSLAFPDSQDCRFVLNDYEMPFWLSEAPE